MDGPADDRTKQPEAGKDKHHTISLVCGVQKGDTNDRVCWIAADSQTQKNELLGTKGEGSVHVRQSLSRVQLFTTPWTVAHQAPLSMEFSRQEHWSGLPLPSPGDLPNSRIKPRSPLLQADAPPSELLEKPQKGKGGDG